MSDKMINYNSSPYNLLVAKFTSQQTWLPYYAHLMDTAGVMDKLVNHWLPLSIIENIKERNAIINIGKVCMFIALTHDIGKATPIFQSKICERSKDLKARIELAGIELQGVSDFLEPNKVPHAYAGEAILLQEGCPAGIAAVVGAHHGTPFPGTEDPEDYIIYYEENFYGNKGEASHQGELWRRIWENWIEFSLDYCGYADITELPEIDVPTQMVLSGLLMMADWIASNENYATLLPLDDMRILSYPARINEIWGKVSFPDQWMPSCFYMDDDCFKDKFGFLPNKVQKAMIEIADNSTTPGIYILEAPMGVGKTEAALSAAEILASKWNCEGVFFGLPTQATANGIFPRLRDWSSTQAENVQLSIRLAHGMAMMQEGYRQLFHGTAHQEEDMETGLLVHPWFEGRKQVLLSSFVVGTVDQLLMAALQQKHVMLRHLGLAGKVVIIDECHAYDAYMSCYLERALEWMGIYKIPVILLSATLPAQRRTRLIEAYCGKSFPEEPDGWKNSESYPLLTYTVGKKVQQQTISVGTENKTVTIAIGKQEDLVSVLKEKLSEGGNAGIIVNTVAQAQEMARCLKEEMKNYEILLLHARFSMADRQQKEQELLNRLGKRSTAEMRNLIVVGTQILEQSLDIDFDLLITQLAPMDLLLQRIGRLHRHNNRIRPEKLKEPLCIVLNCNEMDEGSKQIYGSWLLERTAQILPNIIKLPKDISPLVQQTYRDMIQGEALFPLWVEHNENQIKKERKAKSHRIPAEKDLADTMHGLLDEAVGDKERDALARVRDGESAISVLIMVQIEEENVGFVPWQSKGEKISCGHMPSEEEANKILLQRVQLPRQLSVYKYDECIAVLEEQNMTYLAEWQHSRWLQGELILLLSPHLETEICGYRLKYDQTVGLLYNFSESQ